MWMQQWDSQMHGNFASCRKLWAYSWLCKKHVMLTWWLSRNQCSRVQCPNFLIGACSNHYIIWLEWEKKNLLLGTEKEANQFGFYGKSLSSNQQSVMSVLWNEKDLLHHMQTFTFYTSASRMPFCLLMDAIMSVLVKGKSNASLEKDKHFSGNWSWVECSNLTRQKSNS